MTQHIYSRWPAMVCIFAVLSCVTADAAERRVMLNPVSGMAWASADPVSSVRGSESLPTFRHARNSSQTFSLIPASAPTYRSPVEVLGIGPVTKPLSFYLSNATGVDRLYLRIHRPAYGPEATSAKVSVQLNGGSWIDLLDSNAQVSVEAAAEAYGGLGGGFHTVWVTVFASDFRQGMNTALLRFNGSDSLTSGFRLLNIVPAAGSSLLSGTVLEITDDPNDWNAPDSSDAARQLGASLWHGANLVDQPGGGAIAASCADCHADNGSDLEYYSYSNESIIVRAQHHGLSEVEGEAIASYIRSLSTGRHGRPWQPPYQPGPGLDSRPVTEWAAGAGLQWVLEDDSDMKTYLFPSGTNASQLEAVIDADGELNLRELPVSVQFPDWNEWLPTRHPKDIWPTLWDSSLPNEGYAEIVSTIDSEGVDSLFANNDMVDLLDQLNNGSRLFIRQGYSGGPGGPGGPWRTINGTVIDAAVGLSKERAKEALAKWGSVKYWEIMHDYELEDRASSSSSLPRPEARAWPMKGQATHSPAPHIVANNLNNFDGQPSIVGDYFSSVWYQLNMTLNAGMRQQVNVQPVDWPYQQFHIQQLGRITDRPEPYRYWATNIKMYQTRNNGGGGTLNGWTLRQVHPWRLYSNASGNSSMYDSTNQALRARVTAAFLKSWLEVTQTISLDEWARMPANTTDVRNWYALEEESYAPEAHTGGSLFKTGNFNQADNFYRLIPRLIDIGVDSAVINDLIDWCDEAWPGGASEWQSLRAMSST